MNLSFAGCGFLGIYHVGVACCFRQYAPQLLLDKISGASAGAIAACCLLCDLPLGDMTSDVLRIATEARTSILGPFRPSFNVQDALFKGLEKFLPDDAHIRVSGKLHISLTRVCDGKNVIVSQFDSREDLMQALLASAFVPFFSGLIPPKFHGVRYMDGGLSDNLPTLDENTITVSPFCGESDICPRDDSSQLFHINVANTSIELSKQNIYRFARILFPPSPEILSNMCKQGFDDALRFLHRNNLISCTRCLSVQTTFVVSETLDDTEEYDPQCTECQVHRQQALLSNIPEQVLTIFQEAIESTNKGLINWVFKHRGMKILSVLSLPYTIPFDIAFATYNKLPSVKSNVWDLSRYILEQVAAVVSGSSSKSEKHNSKINCKLLINEYNGNNNCEYEDSVQNKMNLDFTLNLDDSDIKNSTSVNKRLLSRRSSSVIMNKVEIGDDDTFDTILQVTAQHEAIMAYYYTDANNKVNWTEIYDMTDAECEVLQSENEKELNKQLEFDEDWDETTWATHNVYDDDNNSLAGVSDISLEEILDRDSSYIYSDPESEWNPSKELATAIETPDNDDSNHLLRPECEQSPNSSPLTSHKSYTITTMVE